MKAIVGINVMLNSYFLKNNFYPFGEVMDISVAFKFLIIFILVIILISLTKGLHFLMKDDDQSIKMAKSLTIQSSALCISFHFNICWLLNGVDYTKSHLKKATYSSFFSVISSIRI